MPTTPTRRKAGMPPACLEKAAWLLLLPLAVELLALAAVVGLFTLEALR